MRVLTYQRLSQEAITGESPRPPVVLSQQATYPTSRLEHLLLVAIIVLTPLEDHIPAIGGRSILYLVFALLAAYIILMRPWAFAAVWAHPVFLSGYVWLGLVYILESLHANTSYLEPMRITQTLLGGVFVASLCRDRRALRVGMGGYLLAALWLAVLLFVTTYGTLQEAKTGDFLEASRVRAEAFRDKPLEINLNVMSFYASQGAVVALVIALTTQAMVWRIVFLSATTFCLVASFLPLSRSGAIIALISCAAVTVRYGIALSGKNINRLLKTFLLIAALGGCVFALAPEAVFARLAFPKLEGEKTEARVEVYAASIAHFPDYIVSGVGAGNFWGPWGRRSLFCWEDGGMHGAHNVFFQVAIYWGILGVLALCALLYYAYACLPRQIGVDALGLGLLGISIGLGLHLLVTHEVAFKGSSLGLGFLVGCQHWVWPEGIIKVGAQRLLRRHM